MQKVLAPSIGTFGSARLARIRVYPIVCFEDGRWERQVCGGLNKAPHPCCRPSAAGDRDGMGVGDAAESGRPPQGRFGEPERQNRVPVSGRSCGPAVDPLLAEPSSAIA